MHHGPRDRVVEGQECVLHHKRTSERGKGRHLLPADNTQPLRHPGGGRADALPCIYLVDSGSTFLPLQDEVFPDREPLARLLRPGAGSRPPALPRSRFVQWARAPAAGTSPCDERRGPVIVKGTGTIFLGGPPLKAATGEEELGGADSPLPSQHHRSLHRPRTTALALGARDRREPKPPPPRPPGDRGPESSRNLHGIVPEDYRIGYDLREVMARTVDGSRLHEFKRCTATRSSAGSRTSRASRSGVCLANNGVLSSESALKSRRFRRAHGKQQYSCVFSTLMVGKLPRPAASRRTARARRGGAEVHGDHRRGRERGCGRAYSPRQLWMWPNAAPSVMGGERAAMVLRPWATRNEIREKQARGQPVPLDRPHACGRTTA